MNNTLKKIIDNETELLSKQTILLEDEIRWHKYYRQALRTEFEELKQFIQDEIISVKKEMRREQQANIEYKLIEQKKHQTKCIIS